MMHFMKGEIFMKQKTINVELLSVDPDTDILRFNFEKEPLDVNLNSSECQNSLKDIFAVLLKNLIHFDVELLLSVNKEYNRVMYIEVCTEYIKDLKRELTEIKVDLRKELGKEILDI